MAGDKEGERAGERGGKAPRVSIGRLPATGPDLYGREKDLAWLEACWASGVHVAVVVAWGGVGKSALVNAWLAGLRDREPKWGGAARVFAWSFYRQGTDTLSSSDEFFEVALKWFGDPEPSAGSPWDKGERLAARVREARTLLVPAGVDPRLWGRGHGEVEGKLKDPALQALVKELGAQNDGLCVVTSRLPLADLAALEGERVQSPGLDHLSREAGGGAAVKGWKVWGAEDELREASAEYDGHGLALTLLGTYLRKAHKGDVEERMTMKTSSQEPEDSAVRIATLLSSAMNLAAVLANDPALAVTNRGDVRSALLWTADEMDWAGTVAGSTAGLSWPADAHGRIASLRAEADAWDPAAPPPADCWTPRGSAWGWSNRARRRK